MKNIALSFLMLSISIALSGCLHSSTEEVVYIDTPAEGVPVCGELDGEKQTFPSIEEMSNISGALYLHDGPCYE